MGLQEAKKYITQLSRKQGKPELWPDFLTGLPDKSATVLKVTKAIEKGRGGILYIRIADVEPYLVKYGSKKHAEIVKWAAAILQTTAEKYNAFVGYYDTHDFVVILRKRDIKGFTDEVRKLFQKKAESFYSEKDVKQRSVISFEGSGGHVDVGLMRFVFASSESTDGNSAEKILPALARTARKAEKEK